MIWKSNVWYWTLFCPKYCAPSGAAPSPARTAAAAATVPILFTCVLSLLLQCCFNPGYPEPPPAHRPTTARADRTRADPGETRAPRSLRSPTGPSGPVPGLRRDAGPRPAVSDFRSDARPCRARARHGRASDRKSERSEEHTSELQSPDHLVCRLLLEKKKKDETR